MADQSPTILVVEDDNDVRETIGGLLIDSGFSVATAATAVEALALIDERAFDLIVADIRLPGGSTDCKWRKRRGGITRTSNAYSFREKSIR